MGKVGSYTRLTVGSAVVTAFTVVALVASSLAGAAKVAPELVPGAANKTCSDLQGAGQTWIELKVDPNADGVYTDGTLTVTISNTQNDKTFDWSSNIGVDAVFVKAGAAGSYLYRYDPPAEQTSDTGLTSPGATGNEISHIAFCYDVEPRGSLTVIKTVVNDDGGTAASADFTMNVAGPTPLSFPGAPAPGTTNAVTAGAYTVTETGPSGYTLTYSGDCDAQGSVTVPANGTATCTLTNDDIAGPPPPETGTIVVEKQTVPAGDQTQFDFTFGATEFGLADGQSRTFDDLDPGSYAVSEDVPRGWDLTQAACVSDTVQGPIDPAQIELSAGETITCTFTNTKRGTIVVEKQTSPDGAPGSFTFAGDAAATIADGQQIVVSDLVPGTYTSTESAQAGWQLTSIACSDANSSGSLATGTATFALEAGETVTCVFTNAQQTVALGKGSIDVRKSADPTSVKEPGGPVTYTVRIANTSDVDVSITDVVDDKFGDLDDSGGNGCFDVPVNLGPSESVTCQFVGQVTGSAGTEHVNVVCADAVDEFGNPLEDCDDARVTIAPRLIDLAIDKTATSPTPLNGTVNYSLTVTNKGPDTATNVVVADPAPAGIQYQSATPSQGTCALGPALVTCQLGTLAAGQTVTIAITARATAVGTHVNTATVTGDGGREANAADNTDSAQTVVPAPLTPPVAPQKKPPAVDVCVSLTVTPKMIKADGKKDRVVANVRAAKKPMKGVRVVVRGQGVRASGITNAKGVAVIVINPAKPGVLTITTVGKGDSCGARRIGVVGVFLPPLTG